MFLSFLIMFEPWLCVSKHVKNESHFALLVYSFYSCVISHFVRLRLVVLVSLSVQDMGRKVTKF